MQLLTNYYIAIIFMTDVTSVLQRVVRCCNAVHMTSSLFALCPNFLCSNFKKMAIYFPVSPKTRAGV